VRIRSASPSSYAIDLSPCSPRSAPGHAFPAEHARPVAEVDPAFRSVELDRHVSSERRSAEAEHASAVTENRHQPRLDEDPNPLDTAEFDVTRTRWCILEVARQIAAHDTAASAREVVNDEHTITRDLRKRRPETRLDPELDLSERDNRPDFDGHDLARISWVSPKQRSRRSEIREVDQGARGSATHGA